MSEADRLQALADFDILDTPAEEDLDDLTMLVSQICDTPIATITFVDERRQWFKSKIGLTLEETTKAIAFCARAIEQGQPLIVHNALADARFSNNPLVTNEPHLRFYAGIPLITAEGFAVGTLSVMDRVARKLEPSQLFALRVMARQVMKWLELRRSLLRLHDAAEQLSRVNGHLENTQRALKEQIENQTVSLNRAIAEHGKADRLYRNLWETTTDAVLIIDSNSVVRFANPSCVTLFHYRPEELVGQSLAVLQPPRYRESHEHALQRYRKTRVRRLDWRSTEATAVRKDGVEVPVEIAFSELILEQEILFVGFFRDITARKKSEHLLFDQKEQAQATLRSIADGVIVMDRGGRITFMNPLAERLTGWSGSEACGLSHEEVLRLVGADGCDATLPDSFSCEADLPLPLGEESLLLRRRGGDTLCVEGNIAKLRDQAGHHAGLVVAFRDVSRWRQMTAELAYRASHDALTGLVNRREFERRLNRAVEAESPENAVHSLLYLDLDQFKVVNDTCGHIAGDQMLKQLSEALRTQMRSTDTLSRLGGDEFGVLLQECPPAQAAQIAEKLRRAVAEFQFVWGEHVLHIGVSIGQVHFRSGNMSIDELMSKADEACYMAKDLGRDRVHTYRPGDEEFAKRHGEMEWVALIRNALKEKRFSLYSQELFDLRDPHAPRHFEVLVRMRSQEQQLILPKLFVPAAERYNLMPSIDRWVISGVCSHLGAQRSSGSPAQNTCYAMNLSGGSITDPNLADYIRDQLRENGVDGHRVCFEITETAAIGNLSHAVKLMHSLKVLGCRFSLDDFGTGMSSFAYLKRLPVDFLKIDGSFVRDIAEDRIARAMVASIHQIGHLMGLKTVAEFVENERILAELRTIGVDYGQGYGLAEPKPFLYCSGISH